MSAMKKDVKNLQSSNKKCKSHNQRQEKELPSGMEGLLASSAVVLFNPISMNVNVQRQLVKRKNDYK